MASLRRSTSNATNNWHNTSQRISQHRQLHLGIFSQGTPSATRIALQSANKYPSSKLIIKKPNYNIGSNLTEHETRAVSEVLYGIDQRYQRKRSIRDRLGPFFTGGKYVWKFAEAAYISFTVFMLYTMALDYVTGGEIAKGPKD